MNEKLREGLHSIFPVAGGLSPLSVLPRSCRKRLPGLFPVSGKAQRKGEDTTMGDTEYALLLVSVAGGFSDQVLTPPMGQVPGEAPLSRAGSAAMNGPASGLASPYRRIRIL